MNKSTAAPQEAPGQHSSLPATGLRAEGLGLWSGVGLVVSNMVGVGVLTCTGYMARDLSPTSILVAWIVGGIAAMCGAQAYAALAAAIPRSGGEYRFLSDLLHPAVGNVAGWTSLLVGFAAPIAVAAATAGPFAATIAPVSPTLVGVFIIVAATASHALDLRLSRDLQNTLAAVKGVLLVGFVTVGLTLGSIGSRAAETVATGAPIDFRLAPFMVSLVFVAFSYSGWNTVVYAASEFRDPRRTVPRAMLLGTAIVTVFYLLINLVFVWNLRADELAGWAASDTSRITVGHLLVHKIAGHTAAVLMSALVLVSLLSSVSSMTMVGPRVYAEMAKEGFLPRALAGEPGKPPLWSVLIQNGLALVLLLTHSFEMLLRNIGAILTLSSALTVLCLFRLRFAAPAGETGARPSLLSLGSAMVFAALSAWMLWFALSGSPATLLWVLAAVLAALVAYAIPASARRGS